jgi:Sulfotransferase family
MGMKESLGQFREAAGAISARRRRWRRFLAGLALDPDRLPRPVEAPGSRDFFICGASRTGTSLLAAALFQPPSVITVMEPWDGMRLPPADLFRSLRGEIDQTGGLRRGRLDIEWLSSDGTVRWGRDEDFQIELAVGSDYLLGVKWPVFWRYLDLLPSARFLVCVRHPVEVTNSFKRTGGRLAEGLDYDTAFNRRMNDELTSATADPKLRRVLLYEYVTSRLLPHLQQPNVRVVRYERWFTEPETLLRELSDFLEVPLHSDKVRIQPPKSESEGTREQKALIKRYCPSAVALGYRVS